jgi:ubiquinone/menaquinone biosynthesis C-methylase UbiE
MENIKYWIKEDELNNIYTSDYWNNLAEEKRKIWWIEGENYEKCMKYLEDFGLIAELEDAIKFSALDKETRLDIEVADLASGTCWASAIISKLPQVKNIHSVEISKHRIELLAAPTFKMLNGEESKLKRYIGSFYDLKFEDESMDYIFLSQAFHHAEMPIMLLKECNRILKKNGKLILIGEHYIENKKYVISVLKYWLKARKFEIDPEVVLPPDAKLGDHYYLFHQYKFLFKQTGFTFNFHYNKNINRAIYYGLKFM